MDSWNSDVSSDMCEDWKNIVDIDANNYYFVMGVQKNGTVVYSSRTIVIDDERHNISDWRQIEKVSAGGFHSVGLKADGTVVAVGSNDYGECNV